MLQQMFSKNKTQTTRLYCMLEDMKHETSNTFKMCLGKLILELKSCIMIKSLMLVKMNKAFREYYAKLSSN